MRVGASAHRDVLPVHGGLATRVSTRPGDGDPLRGLRRQAERDHQQRLQVPQHQSVKLID